MSDNLWRGNRTKHSAATKKKLSAIAKRRWAKMTPAEKKALSAKIAASLRGRQPSNANAEALRQAEVRAKLAESVKRSWARLTPEQKAARLSKMRSASQSPQARAKRAETMRKMGFSGCAGVPAPMSAEKKVRLFFAAKRGLTHREVAEQIGVSPGAVRRYRDPKSVLPYQRELLRSTVNRHGVETIVTEMVGYKPPCPRCGGKAGVRRDSQRGCWMSDCAKCRRCTTLPAGTRVRMPTVLLDRDRLRSFLLAIAAGREITAASGEARIARSTGSNLAAKILRRWGGYTEADWREPNPVIGRRRRERQRLPKTAIVAPSAISHSPE